MILDKGFSRGTEQDEYKSTGRTWPPPTGRKRTDDIGQTTIPGAGNMLSERKEPDMAPPTGRKKPLTNAAGKRIIILISLQNALRGNRRAFSSCRELPGGARQYGRRAYSPFSSRLNAARQVGRTGSWPLPDRQAHSPFWADAENERAAKLPSKSGTTERCLRLFHRDGGFFYPQNPAEKRSRRHAKTNQDL